LTVKGLSKLQQKLRALPGEVKSQISKAMETSAQEIVDMARNLVPVDELTLYESIGWTWGDPPKGSITLGRSQRNPGDGLRITIFAGNDEAFYARWIEFGTKPHNAALGGGTVSGKKSLAGGGGLGHPGTRAQPFFFVSYRANRRRVLSRISRATTAAARKQAARG
jgi:HK97 gp10 family phage protein